MIAEIHARDGKGGGAGAVVEYALGRKAARTKRAEVVANTTTGRTAREIAQELDAVGALRPDVTTRRVEHYTLSLAPGEGLSVEWWGRLAREYAEHMGHAGCPYVAAVHRDTKHEHLHLIAGRVDVDGRLVSDRRNYRRAQEFCRAKEQELGLRVVASSWEKGVARAEPRPSRGALERADEAGWEEPLAIKARETFAPALRAAGTWAAAHALAAAHGYTIAPGRRGPGLTLSNGFEATKLSTVGRDLSRGNLEQRLGTYERSVTERSGPERERGGDRERSVGERGVGEWQAVPAAGRERERAPAAAARREGSAGAVGGGAAGAAGAGPAIDRASGRDAEPGRVDGADVGGGAGHAPAAGGPARGSAGRGAERGGPGDRRGPGVHDGGGRGADGRHPSAGGDGTGRDGTSAPAGGGERGRGADRPAGGRDRGADRAARRQVRGAGGPDAGGRGAERGAGGGPGGRDRLAAVGDGREGPDAAPPGVGRPGVVDPLTPGGGRGAADDAGAAVRRGVGGEPARDVPRPVDDQTRQVLDRGVHGLPHVRGVPAPAAGEWAAEPVAERAAGPAADAARAAFYADLHATLRAQLGAAHDAAQDAQAVRAASERPPVVPRPDLGAERLAAPPLSGSGSPPFRLQMPDAPTPPAREGTPEVAPDTAAGPAPDAARIQTRAPRSLAQDEGPQAPRKLRRR